MSGSDPMRIGAVGTICNVSQAPHDVRPPSTSAIQSDM